MLHLAGHQLVRRGDGNAVRDAGKLAEVAGVDGPLVPGDPDRGAPRARDRVGGEPQLAHPALDGRLRLRSDVGMQNDEHARALGPKE